jgi:hypothetical protein
MPRRRASRCSSRRSRSASFAGALSCAPSWRPCAGDSPFSLARQGHQCYGVDLGLVVSSIFGFIANQQAPYGRLPRTSAGAATAQGGQDSRVLMASPSPGSTTVARAWPSLDSGLGPTRPGARDAAGSRHAGSPAAPGGRTTSVLPQRRSAQRCGRQCGRSSRPVAVDRRHEEPAHREAYVERRVSSQLGVLKLKEFGGATRI